MLDYDYTKEYGMPIDESLRLLRMKKYPMQLDESIIMVDRLESSGTIKIFESISESADDVIRDISNVECCLNAVQVAEVVVSINQDERKVYLDRFFCEYGYEDKLVPILMEQVVNFTKFYNIKLSLPLRKKHKQQGQTVCERGKAVAKIILGL